MEHRANLHRDITYFQRFTASLPSASELLYQSQQTDGWLRLPALLS